MSLSFLFAFARTIALLNRFEKRRNYTENVPVEEIFKINTGSERKEEVALVDTETTQKGLGQ